MKKLGVVATCLAMTCGSSLFLHTQPALARKPYKDQFDALYVKPESADPKEKALAEAAGAAKCNICHVGKEKKDRNVYGKALAKIIAKKETDVDKIKEALGKVAAEHSNPDDASSPTFGDLIKDGKLPGG